LFYGSSFTTLCFMNKPILFTRQNLGSPPNLILNLSTTTMASPWALVRVGDDMALLQVVVWFGVNALVDKTWSLANKITHNLIHCYKTFLFESSLMTFHRVIWLYKTRAFNEWHWIFNLCFKNALIDRLEVSSNLPFQNSQEIIIYLQNK